ncbi:MAG: S-layer homology domain-containing protein [Clostridia bacterium]|nr:S-layer homology domain-containing protein [Clostridia bacterium]
MKRITALLLTSLMILAALPMTAFGGRFEDVADGKWYSEGISFCAANGYMAGTSETVFDRNGTLTRAMFMTILAKVDGVDLTEYEGKSRFTDVKTDGWYTSAIEWAAENKLASGIGEGVFGYKNSVTREQISLILYSYAEYFNAERAAVNVLPDIPNEGPLGDSSDGDLPESDSAVTEPEPMIDTTLRADLSVFTDAGRVHEWAKDAMEWAVACGLFSGVGEGYLDPRGNCTRAQAAVLIRAFVLGFLSDCEHEWSEATCTEMSVCSKCELKNATELGHDFAEHLCTESVKCSRCDAMSEVSEHNLTIATCTDASVCKKCGFENAPAKGHNMAPATCNAPAKCKNCGITSGTAAGHKPNGSVTNPVCSACGIQCFVDNTQKLKHYILQGEPFSDNCVMQYVNRNYGFDVLITLEYFKDNGLAQLSGYWFYDDGTEFQVCVEIPEISNSYKFEAYYMFTNGDVAVIGNGYLNPAYQTAKPYVGFQNYYQAPADEYSYILDINEMLGYMFTTADETFFNNNPYGLTMKDLGFVNF